MRVHWIVWKKEFIDKFEWKHRVCPAEVEEVLRAMPYVRKAAKGRVQGQDVYAVYGRTEAGRFLIVFFVFKKPDGALPISVRDMTHAERRLYERQKK